MGRRGHEPALLPRNGAGESFVSFIALFGRPARSTWLLPDRDVQSDRLLRSLLRVFLERRTPSVELNRRIRQPARG